LAKEEDPALVLLKEKANKSAVKTVEAILDAPEMKRLIRKTFVREGLLQGFIMAIIFVGLMMVYNAAKLALSFGWQVDLALGCILILFGALSLLKRLNGSVKSQGHKV
jgi:hypothetical protein